MATTAVNSDKLVLDAINSILVKTVEQAITETVKPKLHALAKEAVANFSATAIAKERMGFEEKITVQFTENIINKVYPN